MGSRTDGRRFKNTPSKALWVSALQQVYVCEEIVDKRLYGCILPSSPYTIDIINGYMQLKTIYKTLYSKLGNSKSFHLMANNFFKNGIFQKCSSETFAKVKLLFTFYFFRSFKLQ